MRCSGKCQWKIRSLLHLLYLIVRREEERSSPELHKDAAHRPAVDGVAPIEAKRDLGRTVLPRAHDRRVVLVLPRRPAKVDQRHLRLLRDRAALLESGREEDILRLQVGVRELDGVYVRERLEAVHCDRRDLPQAEVRRRTAARTLWRRRVRRAGAASGDRLRRRGGSSADTLERREERGTHLLEGQAVVPPRLECAVQHHNRKALRG